MTPNPTPIPTVGAQQRFGRLATARAISAGRAVLANVLMAATRMSAMRRVASPPAAARAAGEGEVLAAAGEQPPASLGE